MIDPLSQPPIDEEKSPAIDSERQSVLEELDRRYEMLSEEQRSVIDEFRRRGVLSTKPLPSDLAPPDPMQRESLQERAGELKPARMTVGGFLKNAGPSFVGVWKDMAEGVTSPEFREVAKEIAFPPGMGSKLMRGETPAIVEAGKGMGRRLKERYGSGSDIVETLFWDPFGALSDASVGASAGSALLRTAKTIGRNSLIRSGSGFRVSEEAARTMTKAAKTLDEAAFYLDPVAISVGAPLKVAKIVTAPVRDAAAAYTIRGLGAATGKGRAPEIAWHRGTKEFMDAMRGKIHAVDIVMDARDGLNVMRARRGNSYSSKLTELQQSDMTFDFAPLLDLRDRLLDSYNVKRTPGQPAPPPSLHDLNPAPTKTSHDFRLASVGKKGQATIEELMEVIDDFESAGANSVKEWDLLKRRIDDLYGESNQARAMVQEVKDFVRTRLEDNVLGYKEMTREYADLTRMIDMVDKELSTSQQAGTSVRKLMNALTSNDDFRVNMMELLDTAADTHLVEKVAGAMLHDPWPGGIMRPLTAMTVVWGGTFANPLGAISGLMLSSPRAVGEALVAMSALRRKMASIGSKIPNYPGAIMYRPFDEESEQDVVDIPAGLEPPDPSLAPPLGTIPPN